MNLHCLDAGLALGNVLLSSVNGCSLLVDGECGFLDDLAECLLFAIAVLEILHRPFMSH